MGEHVDQWGTLSDMLIPELLPRSIRRGMFEAGPGIQFWEQVRHRRSAVVPGPHAGKRGMILSVFLNHPLSVGLSCRPRDAEGEGKEECASSGTCRPMSEGHVL